MSRTGTNLAVTKDGEAYNKLRRPDILAGPSEASTLSSQSPGQLAPTSSSKRKLDEVDRDVAVTDGGPPLKHVRKPREDVTSSLQFVAEHRRIARPIKENGMQSMFPGLDGDDGSDETTLDAMAYLHSVRSEASSIPNLLRAVPAAQDSDMKFQHAHRKVDTGMIYEDGTWIAIDVDNANDHHAGASEYIEDLIPQREYHISLLARYQRLRGQLSNALFQDATDTTCTETAQLRDPRAPSTKYAWLHAFEHEHPTPALAVRLDDTNLFCGLQLCAETLLRESTISRTKSCWIWTLLALVGEKGTLDHGRAGKLRDIGVKAGMLIERLRGGTSSAMGGDELDDVDDGSQSPGGSNEDGIAEVQGTVVQIVSLVPGSAKSADGISKIVAAPEDGEVMDIRETHPQANPTGLSQQNDGAHDAESAASWNETQPLVAPGSEPATEEATETSNAASLEEARARLFAQLGDRLIQPSIPPPKVPKHQASHQHGAPHPGGRHRHHGKVCHDAACRGHQRWKEREGDSVAQGLQDMTETENSEDESGALREGIPSREEAERQRQKLREKELKRHDKVPGQSSVQTKLQQRSQVFVDGLAGGHTDRSARSSARDKQSAELEHGQEGSRETDAIDINTRATIDMILTVVAECYGQRDLLQYRDVW